MSFKYGTNGNDLNWDNILELYEYCLECDTNVADFKNNLVAYLEDYLPNEAVDEVVELASEHYDYNLQCEGHTHVYSNLDKEEFWAMYRGKNRFSDGNWFIVRNTNYNSVDLIGNVPDKYLTEEYLAERAEAFRTA